MNIAGELRTARTRAGLSQVELAQRTETSQATVSAYERGRKEPSVATLERLLAALGSRLAVMPAPAITVPSRARHARTAALLLDVLALAAELPTRHEPELRYPKLGGCDR